MASDNSPFRLSLEKIDILQTAGGTVKLKSSELFYPTIASKFHVHEITLIEKTLFTTGKHKIIIISTIKKKKNEKLYNTINEYLYDNF